MIHYFLVRSNVCSGPVKQEGVVVVVVVLVVVVVVVVVVVGVVVVVVVDVVITILKNNLCVWHACQTNNCHYCHSEALHEIIIAGSISMKWGCLSANKTNPVKQSHMIGHMLELPLVPYDDKLMWKKDVSIGSVAAIRKRSRDRRCISCIASGIDNRRCLISRYRRGSTIPPFIHSDTH